MKSIKQHLNENLEKDNIKAFKAEILSAMQNQKRNISYAVIKQAQSVAGSNMNNAAIIDWLETYIKDQDLLKTLTEIVNKYRPKL